MKERQTLRLASVSAALLSSAACRPPCETSTLGCGPRDGGMQDVAASLDARSLDATTPEVDVQVQAIPVGLVRSDDGGCRIALTPGGPTPPWADCVVRLDGRAIPRQVPTLPCGPGRPLALLAAGGGSSDYRYTRQRSSISRGTIEHRIDAAESMQWTWEQGGFKLQPTSTAWMVATTRGDFDAGTFYSAIGAVAPGGSVGRLLFSIIHPTIPREDLNFEGWLLNTGLRSFAASDDLIAFTVAQYHQPEALFVADYNGGPAERIPVGTPHTYLGLSASGPRLLINSYFELYLYDHRTRRAELLLGGDGLSRDEATLLGNEVVYTEFRGDPNAPPPDDVWLLDLATGARTPVSRRDPPVRTVRIEPVMQGDWIVWTDRRFAPDPTVYEPADLSLHGYHRPTGVEVPLVTGVYTASGPILADGQLVYSCRPTRTDPVGLYVMPLPSIPAGMRDR